MPENTESTFRTHFNYAHCMAEQFSGLRLSTTLQPTSQLPTENIDKFSRLADLTKRSIDYEISASGTDHDFASIMVTWLPVKCYYRLYYLETILAYLLNGNSVGFSKKGGHAAIRRAISRYINNGELVFSNVEVSTQTTIRMIRAHVIASGANLSPSYYTTGDCINSVRKKISLYMEHDWKESKGIKAYNTAKARASRDNYYATNTLNLTDFFYWMRIKANYKDLDFLDYSILSPNDAHNYAVHYYNAYRPYASALEALITNLKRARNV